MNYKIAFGALLIISLLAIGCESTPPTEPDTADLTPQETVLSTARHSASKTPIAGVIELVAFNLDEQVCRTTSGGVLQCRGGSVESYLTGDLEGTVIWKYRKQTDRMIDSAEDFYHITTGGWIEGGAVTWNSRTGMIEGAWTGECKVERYLCKGTLVAHGSGDLEGVKFQINWQGLWPFDYEGFALDPHGG
jgi:hypothetical protein